MRKELIDLLKMAKAADRPDFVQAGGGNLSAKIDSRRMLIKASGFKFSELSASKGFVAMDFVKLRENPGRKYSSPAGLIGAGRPSMEAGFHAFLKKYVLHTHSVYVNVLTCSKNGFKKLPQIFKDFGKDAVWLSYFQPGAELAAAVGKMVRRRSSVPEIIFLKNHGLIISADSAIEVLRLHRKINERIKKVLKLEPYPRANVKLTKNIGKQFSKTALFPDQAVFGRVPEILNAWFYIISSLWRLRMPVSKLSPEKTNYLRNMEAEKHRKKLRYSQR